MIQECRFRSDDTDLLTGQVSSKSALQVSLKMLKFYIYLYMHAIYSSMCEAQSFLENKCSHSCLSSIFYKIFIVSVLENGKGGRGGGGHEYKSVLDDLNESLSIVIT